MLKTHIITNLNDLFQITKKSTGEELELVSTNISWSGDRDIKFKHADFDGKFVFLLRIVVEKFRIRDF